MVATFVLLASSLVYLYSEQQKVEHGMKMKVEGLVGTSLFRIWSGYDSMLDQDSAELEIEQVNDMVVKLAVVEAYSEIVDRAVNTLLLIPISIDMKAMIGSMQDSYEANGGFTEQDRSKFETLQKAITELIPLIHQVYYVPESVEGAEVTLQVNNTEELRAFMNKLNAIVAGNH